MISQSNQKYYAAEIMNEQQLDQLSHALYSYCKVMSVPKMGPAPAVITILTGLIATLLFLALGESLLLAVVIGAVLIAVFAFLCWLAYRYRSGCQYYLTISNLILILADTINRICHY